MKLGHFHPVISRKFRPLLTPVSGDLKLLSGGQVENVSVPFSVFFLNI
jgi:hypothetical protein